MENGLKSISFSSLGKHGRLGNVLFQVCSTLGMAEKYGVPAIFPAWEYEQYFEQPLPHGEIPADTARVEEQHFHHYSWQLWENEGNCDLLGYMQSEKYFGTKNPFSFKSDFFLQVSQKMKANGWYNEGHISYDRSSILIHIRKGDYVGNHNYYALPITYYIDALITHFPNWQQCNIVIISDDLPYCKIHFECLPNAYFADGLNDIESMALGSMCDHFILSNSSFSWWTAWLGENKGSKVVHPGHLFTGRLAEKNYDTKDFWPDRWIEHKKDSYKLDLSDMTFTIPVFHDHKDRRQNLDLSVCMLQMNFTTKIIVGEQGSSRFGYMSQYCDYTHFVNLKKFHRTRMLNQMAIQATTAHVANWDCDVIIAPMQIYLAVLALRNGADMVFPYDGRFARLPRVPWFGKIQTSLDIGIIGDNEPKGKRGRAVPESSVGGAVFFNKKSFIEGGMENENMISFGPEDCERNDRFTMLGYDIKRIGGCLFHIDHWCGPDSSKHNPFFRANHKELDKIRLMDRDALQRYVATWPWRPVVVSPEEVMKVLEGYCQWAHQQTGLEYKVMTRESMEVGSYQG